ncbi:putative L-lactate dehydrogenase operon regulatory protein [Clostridiales bacterium]|nr:putative L-lactate dehydrogenase operon regulatory protein [Clostridiales bacterium]
MVKNNTMLSEKVADQILKMITIEKKFNIGDKLPNENELSNELGVSRTTLREAVKFLIAHNVLEIKRGKGTYVADNKDLNEDYGFSELDNLAMSAMDFFETRVMMEPTMANYAAQRATSEDIEKLVELDLIVNEHIEDVDLRTEYDQKFHYAIAAATKNEFVIKMLPVIYAGMDMASIFKVVSDDVKSFTLDDHKMILEFIKKGDSAGAEAAMRMHLVHAYNLAKDIVK